MLILASGVLVFLGGLAAVLLTRKNRGLIHPQARWPRTHMPLMIAVDPSAAAWRQAIAEAILDWCRALGFDAFILVDLEAGLSGGSVIPFVEDDHDENPRTTLTYRGDLIAGARITVPSNTPMQKRRCIVRHELGHVLGLDHDDDADSAMHPAAVRGLCVISPDDIAILKRVYSDGT